MIQPTSRAFGLTFRTIISLIELKKACSVPIFRLNFKFFMFRVLNTINRNLDMILHSFELATQHCTFSAVKGLSLIHSTLKEFPRFKYSKSKPTYVTTFIGDFDISRLAAMKILSSICGSAKACIALTC